VYCLLACLLGSLSLLLLATSKQSSDALLCCLVRCAWDAGDRRCDWHRGCRTHCCRRLRCCVCWCCYMIAWLYCRRCANSTTAWCLLVLVVVVLLLLLCHRCGCIGVVLWLQCWCAAAAGGGGGSRWCIGIGHLFDRLLGNRNQDLAVIVHAVGFLGVNLQRPPLSNTAIGRQ
jgi:hypothetical protein